MRDQSGSISSAIDDAQTHSTALKSKASTTDLDAASSSTRDSESSEDSFLDENLQKALIVKFADHRDPQGNAIVVDFPHTKSTMHENLSDRNSAPTGVPMPSNSFENSVGKHPGVFDPTLFINKNLVVDASGSDIDSAEEAFMDMDWAPQDLTEIEEAENGSEAAKVHSIAPVSHDLGNGQQNAGAGPLEPPFFEYHAQSEMARSETGMIDKDSEPIDWSMLQKKDEEPPILQNLEQLTRKRKYGIPKTIAPPRKVGDLGERFHANINYARLYNRHVSDSLDWSTGEGKGPTRDYFASRITASTYADPKGGELWSVDEKLTFFKALARYSIHRLDDIEAQLPSKSKGLILAYYFKLRDQLKKFKQDRVRYHPKFRYVFEDKNNEGHVEWINMHFYDDGAVYSNMPIAYEMSESFIRFEEKQAELLRYDNAVAAPMKRRDYGPLFNYDGIKDLSANVFDHNRIVCGKAPRQMQRNANVLLEDLVVMLVRKIMSKIILNKVWSQSPDIEHGTYANTEVTDRDVHFAMSQMRYAPEDDHVFSWNHIWAKMPERLKLQVIDTERSGPMTHQEAETYILFHSNTNRSSDSFAQLYHDRWQVCGPSTAPGPAFTAIDIEGENLINEEEHAERETEKEVGEIAIKSTSSKPPIISIDDAFKNRKRAHYNSEKEHEEFSLHMLEMETAKLEKQDTTNSAIYEHTLLASMAKKDIDHDLDAYNIHEAMEIVQEWDDATAMSSSSEDESQLDSERVQYVRRRKRMRLELYQEPDSETEIEYSDEEDPGPVMQEFTSRDKKRRLQNMDNEYAYYSIYD